jgi:fatty-acyl-CoA synthase
MIDGYKDSNYIQIINEICPELKTASRAAVHKQHPLLKNVITVIQGKRAAIIGTMPLNFRQRKR